MECSYGSVHITQVEGVKFSVQSRSHTIICDQSQENGGTDAGMTPPEFLLASLDACEALYAAEYLRSRNLAKTGLSVSVEAEKLKSPARSAISTSVSTALSASLQSRAKQ